MVASHAARCYPSVNDIDERISSDQVSYLPSGPAGGCGAQGTPLTSFATAEDNDYRKMQNPNAQYLR